MSWFVALSVMFTSTVSAAMMGGSGHGHMSETSHHGMAVTTPDCAQNVVATNTGEETKCEADLHNASLHSDQMHESPEDMTMQCNVCALCTSIIQSLDVDLQFIARALPVFSDEPPIFHSKFSTRLERPPRS